MASPNSIPAIYELLVLIIFMCVLIVATLCCDLRDSSDITLHPEQYPRNLLPSCPTSDPVQTHQPQIRVYFMKTNSVNEDNEPPPYSSLFSADSPTSEPTPRIE